MKTPFRCGFIAIVGRPNVGKSTLMNHLLGQKLSITSSKPQTTRHRILGIHTDQRQQAIYVDTPGIHLTGKSALNRYMNKAAAASLADVDAIIMVVEANRWTEEDVAVLKQVTAQPTPVILAVNKVDMVADKASLLPLLAELGSKGNFAAVVPLSALKETNLKALQQEVWNLLPEGEPIFPEEQITDRSERFLAAEIIREKLMRALGQELPYAITVEIEQFKEESGRLIIHALIWVERASQKKIVIGKGGQMLKEIGSQSRIDMQRLFGNSVHLQMWVKVKEGWSDNERILGSLGYKDDV